MDKPSSQERRIKIATLKIAKDFWKDLADSRIYGELSYNNLFRKWITNQQRGWATEYSYHAEQPKNAGNRYKSSEKKKAEASNKCEVIWFYQEKNGIYQQQVRKKTHYERKISQKNQNGRFQSNTLVSWSSTEIIKLTTNAPIQTDNPRHFMGNSRKKILKKWIEERTKYSRK